MDNNFTNLTTSLDHQTTPAATDAVHTGLFDAAYGGGAGTAPDIAGLFAQQVQEEQLLQTGGSQFTGNAGGFLANSVPLNTKTTDNVLTQVGDALNTATNIDGAGKVANVATKKVTGQDVGEVAGNVWDALTQGFTDLTKGNLGGAAEDAVKALQSVGNGITSNIGAGVDAAQTAAADLAAGDLTSALPEMLLVGEATTEVVADVGIGALALAPEAAAAA